MRPRHRTVIGEQHSIGAKNQALAVQLLAAITLMWALGLLSVAVALPRELTRSPGLDNSSSEQRPGAAATTTDSG